MCASWADGTASGPPRLPRGSVPRHREPRELLLAHAYVVRRVPDGRVESHPAVAVSVHVPELDVLRIRDLDSVRERVVRADHAVHVVIRQGDVAGILNLHRRAHGPLINESLPASHFTPRARGLMPFVYTPNPIMMFVPPLGANTIG